MRSRLPLVAKRALVAQRNHAMSNEQSGHRDHIKRLFQRRLVRSTAHKVSPASISPPAAYSAAMRYSHASAASPLTAHQLRRIAAPAGMRVQHLALHQERVGIEHHMVAHGDAIVHEGAGSDRAAIAHADVVGLEHALFQRMRLQHGALVEVGVVADLGQRALGDRAAAVEDLLADLHAQRAEHHGAERRAVEQPGDRRFATVSSAARGTRSTDRRSRRASARGARRQGSRARSARRTRSRPPVIATVAANSARTPKRS